jgi:hypothetical protein
MKAGPGRIALGIAALAAGAAALALQDAPVPDDLLVYTQVSVPSGGAAPDWRFPASSRIVALDLSNPDAGPIVLTPDFEAARAPDVHFDGRRIVFAGQREAGGPWQIWEMDLDRRDPRLLVSSCQQCTDPVYRPDDGVVFVAPGDDPSTLALYTVEPDGGQPRRITYHPLSDAAPTLISDGRIVVATGEGSTDGSATDYYALRHDGTGAELLYGASDGAALLGRAHEASGRELVFVERTPGGGGETIVSVSEAYPSTSRRELPVPSQSRVRSVFPMADGSLIAALQPEGSPVFGLWQLARGGGPGERLPGAEPHRHAVEPVRATRRDRPLGFVSALDPSAGSGSFFGMDARLSGLGSIDSAAAVLKVRTPAGDLGEVPLAPDGSFHIELPANTPLQLETLDRNGRVVRGPSAWIWVRPGELRGCVGCHEDRALTPENRLPAAAGEPALPLLVVPGPRAAVAAEGGGG